MAFLMDISRPASRKWVLNHGCLVILVFALFPNAKTTPTPIFFENNVTESIANFITNTYLPANNHPALSLTVTNANGSFVYSTGFGLMDEQNQVPTTNDTLFLLGSLSKSFAAIIVCKTLHEKFPELGEKALDTPVSKLIPDFNFTLNDRYRSEATTFRDMLSHRVCSKTDGMATLMVPFKTPSEVAFRQRYANEVCGFRTGFVYNNGMYALVSSAVEAITNRSYEDLILELLSDLGMHNSTIIRDTDDDKPPNRAIPYYWRNQTKHEFNPGLLKRVSIAPAAGGIVTSALNMIKYIQFHLNKGKVGDRQVVPSNVMEWLYKTAIHYPLISENDFKPYGTDINVGYALGLFQQISDGWQRIAHAGNVPPFTSEMSFYPAFGFGIYTATNLMPEGNISQSQLHRGIFDILRNRDPSVALENNASSGTDIIKNTEQPTIVTIPVEKLENFTGTFGNGLQGELELTLKFRNETNTTELYMNYGRWGQAYLLATEVTRKFLVYWDSDVVQDKYSYGMSEYETFGFFSDNLNEFHIVDFSEPTGQFIRDVTLENLPSRPWDQGSCGPSQN